MRSIVFHPEVQTFDIDAMGHVSNITFIRWMKVARCKILEEVGMPIHTIMEQGFGPVLVETQISYKHQVKLGDKVKVEMWLSELAKASAWLEHMFSDGQGKVFATGRQRGIFLDFNTNRPRRLKDNERSLFEPYQSRDRSESRD